MAFRKLYSTKKVIFDSFKVIQVSSTRNICVTSLKCEKVEALAMKSEIKPEWDRALSEGEKCVGYQKSFMSLRYLLNDEVTNWGEHMQKLEGSNHPMYSAARNLFRQGNENINQTWALVVLLVSKMGGLKSSVPQAELDEATGLLKTQKILAETLESTCSGNDIHREGVLNMQNLQYAGINLPFDSDLIFGNKMAILGGDILMGQAAISMAKIRNHDANILLCTAARDVADSNFIGDRDIQNNPLPSDPVKKLEEQKNNPLSFDEISTDQIDNTKPFDLRDIMGSAENEWKLRETLAGGTLLGKSCQAALMLSKHELQKEAYFFGKHLYLGWKASKDLETFMPAELPASSQFSLVSAPVLFHLEHDHSLYDEIKKGLDTVENVDYVKIYAKVRNDGPGIEKAKELLSKNNLIAKTLLHKFPQSSARRALENIIVALEN